MPQGHAPLTASHFLGPRWCAFLWACRKREMLHVGCKYFKYMFHGPIVQFECQGSWSYTPAVSCHLLFGFPHAPPHPQGSPFHCMLLVGRCRPAVTTYLTSFAFQYFPASTITNFRAPQSHFMAPQKPMPRVGRFGAVASSRFTAGRQDVNSSDDVPDSETVDTRLVV